MTRACPNLEFLSARSHLAVKLSRDDECTVRPDIDALHLQVRDGYLQRLQRNSADLGKVSKVGALKFSAKTANHTVRTLQQRAQKARKVASIRSLKPAAFVIMKVPRLPGRRCSGLCRWQIE